LNSEDDVRTFWSKLEEARLIMLESDAEDRNLTNIERAQLEGLLTDMTSIRERLATEQAAQSFVFRSRHRSGKCSADARFDAERDGQASQRARKEPMASTKTAWRHRVPRRPSNMVPEAITRVSS
jgi:hypothetical protein